MNREHNRRLYMFSITDDNCRQLTLCFVNIDILSICFSYNLSKINFLHDHVGKIKLIHRKCVYQDLNVIQTASHNASHTTIKRSSRATHGCQKRQQIKSSKYKIFLLQCFVID